MCTNFLFNTTSKRIALSHPNYFNLPNRNYDSIPSPSRFEQVGEECGENVPVERCTWFGKRHVQLILLAWGWFLVASVKSFLSITIVAMTDPSASSNPDIPTYNWTNKNLLLSSFYCGYWIPQLFAGWLTTTYLGPKWIYIAAIGSCSFISFLIPTAAVHLGSTGVLICRFLQGCSAGFTGSAMYSFYGNWIPINERNRSVGFVFIGGTLGIICSMFFIGEISASEFGWPLTTLLYGSFGFIWCIVFGIFGHASPDDHPTISTQEKELIRKSAANPVNVNNSRVVPWKRIFSSVCFWALVLAQCGQMYPQYLLSTETSSFLKSVLKMDMLSNGTISALPYICAGVLTYFFGLVSDNIIANGVCSIGGTRKLLLVLGFVVPGLAFILVGYCEPEDSTMAVVLLVVGIGVDYGVNMNGLSVNYIDLAPNHSGPLLGIGNQFSQPFAALAPLTVHFLVTDETDINQWKTVYFIAMGFKALTGMVFIIFGSGSIQPWNQHEQIEDEAGL
ncbi:unnamed protein product [Phyllotreta striolata]|uniref:Major facilitator superfamily (MFS) profile domain-containing protein n=1 Tax=Phyllotreta striolata TaxID=444603 RepID=A0A9N9XNY2_PHYSR|nr:unnamed protein product [Phyllotreta striolata]